MANGADDGPNRPRRPNCRHSRCRRLGTERRWSCKNFQTDRPNEAARLLTLKKQRRQAAKSQAKKEANAKAAYKKIVSKSSFRWAAKKFKAYKMTFYAFIQSFGGRKKMHALFLMHIWDWEWMNMKFFLHIVHVHYSKVSAQGGPKWIRKIETLTVRSRFQFVP